DIDAIDADLGDDLGAQEDWQSIKAEWSALKSHVLTLPPDDSAIQHDELINHLLQFTSGVTLRSGMSRDPEAVVGALVELSTEKMPAALNEAGVVRDRATAGVLRGYLGEGDRTMITASRQDVAATLAQIDRQLS